MASLEVGNGTGGAWSWTLEADRPRRKDCPCGSATPPGRRTKGACGPRGISGRRARCRRGPAGHRGRPRLARPHEALERLEALGVGRCPVLVEDHEVDVEHLEPPVLVRARPDCRTMSMSSASSIRTMTIGGSPGCRGPTGRGRPLVAGQQGGRRSQRQVQVDTVAGAGTGGLRRARSPGDGAGPARGGAVAAFRRRPSRGSCRLGRVWSRDSATTVEKIAWAVAPGASFTRRRRLKIRSRTGPTV